MARRKVLGLPIGRRRTSRVRNEVVAGGAALLVAVPAAVRIKRSVEASNRDAEKDAKRDAAGGSKEGARGGRSDSRTAKLFKRHEATSIIESIDVGAPVHTAYEVWTQSTDFPATTRKAEDVDQDSDESLGWADRISWAGRTRRSQLLEQTPDHKIIWRSEGSQGIVDGAVSFHELAPDLTRLLVVLEYHPRGSGRRGKLEKAQARRARLELKNFQRYVLTEIRLPPEESEAAPRDISEGSAAEEDHSEPGEEAGSADEQGTVGERPDEASSDKPRDEDQEEAVGADGSEGSTGDRAEQEGSPEQDQGNGGDEDGEGNQSPIRRRSQPGRRQAGASAGDDGEEDTGSPVRRAPRSSKSEQFHGESDGELGKEAGGQSGRVIGQRSGRRVGARQTREGVQQ